MITYNDCLELIQKGRKGRKKLRNNTYLYERDGAFLIVLHSTAVVTLYRDGSCKLDSGGWMTVTTKKVINSVMGRGFIYQRDFTWFLDCQGEEHVKFTDGMVIQDRVMSQAA